MKPSSESLRTSSTSAVERLRARIPTPDRLTASTLDRAASRSPLVDAALVATPILVLLWVVIALLVDDVRFVLLTPDALTSIDAASALSRIFGALVLFLFPSDRLGPRLRWIAGGLIVLGLGGLLFRVVWPLTGNELTPDNGAYASIVVWSAAGIMFVAGLAPISVSDYARRWTVSISVVLLTAALLVFSSLDALPELISASGTEFATTRTDAPLRGLSEWHWLLSSIPLALALVAVVGAAYFYLRSDLGAWLVIAMMLLAGSQFHNLFWPSAYSPVLTTSDVLRFLFGAVVLTGGVISLCRVAAEREKLLAVEKEYSRRVSELAMLKDNFTAMVAHELHSPLAAVRSLSSMLEYPDIDPERRAEALEMIRHEVGHLSVLVNDVQDISAVERSSFEVHAQPVALERIMEDVSTYQAALPDSPVVTVVGPPEISVIADQERIGQVLRNLVNNAIKYAPEGTPVEVRAIPDGPIVRIEVVDQGYGIEEADQLIIFECFGRGRDPRTLDVRGSGLGLYLSRRIVEAHGNELRVASVPERGSTFSFDLRVAT